MRRYMYPFISLSIFKYIAHQIIKNLGYTLFIHAHYCMIEVCTNSKAISFYVVISTAKIFRYKRRYINIRIVKSKIAGTQFG